MVRRKAIVETGMTAGRVAWIGDVRVAEMRQKTDGVDMTEFDADSSKIIEECKNQGFLFDGMAIKARYAELTKPYLGNPAQRVHADQFDHGVGGRSVPTQE